RRGAGGQRREELRRRGEAADHVDEGRDDLQRTAAVAGLTRDRHQSAHRREQQVVAGKPRRELTRAERADRAEDHALLLLGDGVIAEPEALEGPRTERLDEDVRALAERSGELDVAGVFEVERDRALVAVEPE